MAEGSKLAAKRRRDAAALMQKAGDLDSARVQQRHLAAVRDGYYNLPAFQAAQHVRDQEAEALGRRGISLEMYLEPSAA